MTSRITELCERERRVADAVRGHLQHVLEVRADEEDRRAEGGAVKRHVAHWRGLMKGGSWILEFRGVGADDESSGLGDQVRVRSRGCSAAERRTRTL